jgi:predicted RNA-binding protein
MMQKYNKDGLTIKQLVETMVANNENYPDILYTIFSTKEWFPDNHSIAMWHVKDFFGRNYKKDLSIKVLKYYEIIEEYIINQKEIDDIFINAQSKLKSAYANANANTLAYAYANALADANALAYVNAYAYAYANALANADAIAFAFANAYARIEVLIKQDKED